MMTRLALPRRLRARTAMLRGFVGWAADRRGAAAVEFSMVAGLFIVATLNTYDISTYLYQQMEVQSAAQMGSQAAWKTCPVANLPATTNCTGLNAAVTAAVQASSLGSHVTLSTGSPTEGYYCVNSSGALVNVSDVSSKPSDCSSVGNAGATPGDYLKVQVSYTYTPTFTGFSVGGVLPSSITSTSMMRLQ